MKILIVSDTHKSHKNLDKVLEIVKPIDMLIHLGDVEEKTTTSRRWQTVLRI